MARTVKVMALIAALGLAPVPIVLVRTPWAIVLTELVLVVVAFLMARRFVRVEEEAKTDALTGLGNRRALDAALAAGAESATEAAPLLVVLLDLDGFKTYNDTFGHAAGDALLARLGARLRAALGPCASPFRHGGDEFCVLATGECVEDVAAAAVAALTEAGGAFTVTASHGTVLVPAEATGAADALRLADGRMYAAKHARRLAADRQSKDVLLAAVEERNPELRAHLRAVAVLAGEVARQLGLSPDEAQRVELAAELHDVGKMAIPDAILAKPGPLSDDEWRFVRGYPAIGERIVAAAPSLGGIAPLVRSSAERWDGKGYPDGLTGEAIPLASRVVAACDAFVTMTTDRAYRRAVGAAEALAQLERGSGRQFDPAVVAAVVVVAGRDRLAAAA